MRGNFLIKSKISFEQSLVYLKLKATTKLKNFTNFLHVTILCFLFSRARFFFFFSKEK